MNNKAAGFTLLELVTVILILGILAAVAIPKYIDTVQSARVSALNGLGAGLSSAKNLAQSEYRLEGNSYNSQTTAITVDGKTVEVVPKYGAPTTNGITGMLESSYANAFATTYAGGNGVEFHVKDFSGASLEKCYITYDPVTTVDNPVSPLGMNTSGC